MKLRQLKVLFLTVFLNSAPAFPSEAVAQNFVTVSPAVLYFHYVEYEASGQELDKETGFLPGFVFTAERNNGAGFYLHGGLSLYDGRVNYDGQLQNGTPYQTHTDTRFSRLELTLGKRGGNDNDIFLHLQHVVWDRDIRPNKGALGLHEWYQWNEVGAGIRQLLFNQPGNSFFITFDIFKITSPSITVDLNEIGYGSPELSLGERSGYRLRLDWQTFNREQFDVGVGVFYEQYSFGASDKLAVNGASGTLLVQEPRSESRQLGAQFNLIKRF